VAVREMFDSIAPRYDFLNRLLSAGRDIHWRRFAVEKLITHKEGTYLDVATGTGDVALEITRQAPSSRVVGLDFASRMLELARAKITGRPIELIRGDALAMPFPDNTFQGSIVAYGVRNFPDRLQGLKEMVRVVKPGGRVVVLEFSTPPGLVGEAYHLYFHYLLPRIGGLISGNPGAYSYLHESVEAFPAPQVFCDMMVQAGLARVRALPLTFGITMCYVGEKPWPTET
jgi:demethylmenaquinone methyltransferase/2-methoxy-6-polyprenyl-1,4-benzoquinol methylase